MKFTIKLNMMRRGFWFIRPVFWLMIGETDGESSQEFMIAEFRDYDAAWMATERLKRWRDSQVTPPADKQREER